MSAVANTTMLSQNNLAKKRKNITTGENEECNKKQKTRPIGIAKNFQGSGAQARAMASAEETNGVIFGRDHGKAKQYYVSPDKDHMYNFIFGHYKKKRHFYEWIPQNTPVRLYLDLEIERVKVEKKTNKELYRYEGEDLFAAINDAEAEVTRVVVEQLKEQHRVQVDESQILSLNSDGTDKGSRHVIFPVWFDDNGTSMESFVLSILGLLSTDVGQRATDKGVYTKHRLFRFFGNTKIGKERWLHLPSQPDLKPFTPEHRAKFDASLVEAPPPEGVVPIHIATSAKSLTNKKRKRNGKQKKYTGEEIFSRGSVTNHEWVDKGYEHGLVGEFRFVRYIDDGDGIEVRATTPKWTCCCGGREHVSNKTIRFFHNRSHCLGPESEDKPKCGVKSYPPLAKELAITNEHYIRQKVAEHWNVNAKDITAKVQGKNIFYRVDKDKCSIYDQHTGALRLQKDIKLENVDVKDVEQLVKAHWTVEKVKTTDKKKTILYIAGIGKRSTYTKKTRILMLQSMKLKVDPIYKLWDGKAEAIEAGTPFVPATATIDGDTVLCKGTRLPLLEFIGPKRKLEFKDGTLYLPKGGTYVAQACMAKGKTYTLMQALKKATAEGLRVLFVTYRVSLADDLFSNLCKAIIDGVLHYRKGLWFNEGLLTYKKDFVPECKAMVCQLESISKVADAKWDIIVSDEVQGLSAQFNSTTFDGNGCNSWQTWKKLESLYRTTPTAVFMDADFEKFTTRGRVFVNNMRGSFVHIVHRGKPKQRTYIDTGTKEKLLGVMADALTAGKKVFVTSNTRTFVEVANETAKRLGFKTAVYHSGEVPEGEINDVASRCDMMAISTGKIGSGVSIENAKMYPKNADGTPHPDFRPFDILISYGMASDMVSPFREKRQGDFRCRDLSIVFYCIKEMPQPHRHRNYKSAWDEARSMEEKRQIVFHKRHVAAQKAADESAIRGMQATSAAHFIRENPAEAEECNYNTDAMVQRGWLPNNNYCYNSMLVEVEKIESSLNFRSLFINHALEDGHQIKRLEEDKDTTEIAYKKVDRLPAMLEAVPETEYKQWSGWDASEIVKLKTRNVVDMFNLDPEKTQLNCHKSSPHLASAFPNLLLMWLRSRKKAAANYQQCRCVKQAFNHWKRMETQAKNNQLLTTFFKNKLSMQEIDEYKSYKYRFYTREQLQNMNKQNAPFKSSNQTPIEKHLDFLDALDFVFTHQFKITTGNHAGKKAYIEPPTDAEKQKSMAAIEQIVPRQGKIGQGTEWFKRTAALLRWFGENGVKTCLRKFRTKIDGSKHQCWLIDDASGKEYASMMRVHVVIPDNERTHTFDTICKSRVLYDGAL